MINGPFCKKMETLDSAVSALFPLAVTYIIVKETNPCSYDMKCKSIGKIPSYSINGTEGTLVM